MQISLIAALSHNFVIGKNNQMPWYLPVDLKFFKNKTLGHHILMGRKTFESLGAKPLSNRIHLIISKTKKDYHYQNVISFTSIDHAINYAYQNKEEELFVIGGSSIYKQTMERAHKMYITMVNILIEGDSYFPVWNKKNWLLEKKIFKEKDQYNPYDCDFLEYRRLFI